MLAWLSVWSEVQICILPSWCHCHSRSLAPVNPDWFYQNGSAFIMPAYTGCPGEKAVYRVTACAGLQANAYCLGLCLHGIQSFQSGGKAPLKLENIYQRNTEFENLQKSVILSGAFPKLRIISRQHFDRHQVLLTVDWRPSPVNHTQHPALWWWLGVTQCITQSVGVSHDLYCIN